MNIPFVTNKTVADVVKQFTKVVVDLNAIQARLNKENADKDQQILKLEEERANNTLEIANAQRVKQNIEKLLA